MARMNTDVIMQALADELKGKPSDSLTGEERDFLEKWAVYSERKGLP